MYESKINKDLTSIASNNWGCEACYGTCEGC